MPVGKVRFYKKDKGWGFISREGEKDIFFGGKFEDPTILDRCGSAEPNTIAVEFFIGAKPDGRSYAYKLKLIEPNSTEAAPKPPLKVITVGDLFKNKEEPSFADSIGFVEKDPGSLHYDDGLGDEYDHTAEY